MHRLFSRYFPSKRRYYSRSSSGWEHLRMNHLQTERFLGDLPSHCSVETKPTNCQSSAAHCVCTSYFRASLSSARIVVRHWRTHETLAWKFARAKTFRKARGHRAYTDTLSFDLWQIPLLTKITYDKNHRWQKQSITSNVGNFHAKLQTNRRFLACFRSKERWLHFWKKFWLKFSLFKKQVSFF